MQKQKKHHIIVHYDSECRITTKDAWKELVGVDATADEQMDLTMGEERETVSKEYRMILDT